VIVWLHRERMEQHHVELQDPAGHRLRARHLDHRPAGPIPVNKSTWWQGVKDGRLPKPVKLGVKTTAWRVDDIRALIERLGR
jgi:prophage regulatory protein